MQSYFHFKDIDTNKNNSSNFKTINLLIKKIKKIISKKITLVILSQVVPGFTEKIIWNKNKLFYQVETLIFGKAINRALNPSRIIIGSNFKKIKDINIQNPEYVKFLKI